CSPALAPGRCAARWHPGAWSGDSAGGSGASLTSLVLSWSGVPAVLTGGDDAREQALHVGLGHGHLGKGAINALDGPGEALVDVCLAGDPPVQALVAFIQFDDERGQALREVFPGFFLSHRSS